MKRSGTIRRGDPSAVRRIAAFALAMLALVALVAMFAGGCSNSLSQAQKAEQSGDLSSAGTLYLAWLQTHPNDLAAMKALAAVYYVERKWDEALPWQQKAVALDPKEARIRVELGFNYLSHQNDPAKAVEVMKEAVALEPTAQYLGFLAQAQEAVNDNVGAEASLRKALAADKTYPHTYSLLVSMFEHQGRTAEAADVRAAAQAQGIALQSTETTG
jgi:predicted Zn-dependent protease